jgi:hypothetical protein
VSVERMLNEAGSVCPICGRPVRRRDRRVLTDGRLAHLACTGRPVDPDPPPEGYEEAKLTEVRKLAALRAEVAERKAALPPLAPPRLVIAPAEVDDRDHQLELGDPEEVQR